MVNERATSANYGFWSALIYSHFLRVAAEFRSFPRGYGIGLELMRDQARRTDEAQKPKAEGA